MIDLSKAPPINESDFAEFMEFPPMGIEERCKAAGKDLKTTIQLFLAFVPDWRRYHTEDASYTMTQIINRSDEENQRLLDLKWRGNAAREQNGSSFSGRS